MGTLYLVRHGQASFGADDYDHLSDLGQRQSVRLGEYFRDQGLVFDAVLTGTLRRHLQTWQGIATGLGAAPEAIGRPGLNEYDSAALIATVHPGPLEKPDTPELYRHHFRLLRSALAQWMAGTTQPVGMPAYADFLDGVTSALDEVRRLHAGGKVLIVSSGGPIATAVGHVLRTPPETTIELNLRIRNTAVTEFAVTPSRHVLVSFNSLPHLDSRAQADWITHA